MIPATLLRQGARIAGPLALFLAGFCVVMLVVRLKALPETPADGAGGLSGDTAYTVAAVTELPPASAWKAFRAPQGSVRPATDAVAARFRLAGTFFEFTGRGSSSRRAIVEDLEVARQEIVEEGNAIGDYTVKRILRDRITIHDSSGQEYDLWLRSSSLTGSASSGGADASTTREDGDAGGTGTFGATRLGERRWRFDRDRMMDYYRSLRDQPERLVLLFDSMKPVYTVDNFIEGYVLGMEGEQDFFNAVGLQEADVVRAVNGVKMINRRRAEFFIKQFAESDASAFVLDVERNGKVEKFTYEVR